MIIHLYLTTINEKKFCLAQ